MYMYNLTWGTSCIFVVVVVVEAWVVAEVAAAVAFFLLLHSVVLLSLVATGEVPVLSGVSGVVSAWGYWRCRIRACPVVSSGSSKTITSNGVGCGSSGSARGGRGVSLVGMLTLGIPCTSILILFRLVVSLYHLAWFHWSEIAADLCPPAQPHCWGGGFLCRCTWS